MVKKRSLINIRLNDEEKEKIKKASEKLGLNLGSFCRFASLEKANKFLEENNHATTS